MRSAELVSLDRCDRAVKESGLLALYISGCALIISLIERKHIDFKFPGVSCDCSRYRSPRFVQTGNCAFDFHFQQNG